MTAPESGPPNDASLALEKRKIAADVWLRKRKLDLEAKDLKFKIDEVGKFRLSNPLTLGILSAAIAAIATISGQVWSGHNQFYIDEKKHDQEMETEKFKAEAGRILESIKASDPDKAACNLKFILDVGLIETEKLRRGVSEYLRYRSGGTGVAFNDASSKTQSPSGNVAQDRPPTAAATVGAKEGQLECQSLVKTSQTAAAPSKPSSQPNPPTTPSSPIIFNYETDWMGGGHNQDEACRAGIATNQQKYPGKMLSRMSSGESVKKDLFGHVEYKYFCVIKAE